MIGSEISYAEASGNLSLLLDRVAENNDIVIVKRDGKAKSVALIAEEDLSSLMETVYLLRSPANAARLHGAIERAKERDLEGDENLDVGLEDPAAAIASLCQELGIVRQKER
jgi:antitoxin YefM